MRLTTGEVNVSSERSWAEGGGGGGHGANVLFNLGNLILLSHGLHLYFYFTKKSLVFSVFSR